MKINLSPDQKNVLETLVVLNPHVQNIKLAGVEYDLRAELVELRGLSKSILTSQNKDVDVSRTTNQNISNFVEGYLRPCFNRINILQGKPDDVNTHVVALKQEVDSAKDFYLENLKLKLDIENIDATVSLLEEKTEMKATEDTITQASDLLDGTVKFYQKKERNTFIALCVILCLTALVLLIDFIKPNWLCFCFGPFCIDFTSQVTDKWVFIQHVTSKITFILVVGYLVNILARNYKLYSGLHVKNKSRNDVANILLKQGEILQKSNLITTEMKATIMQSILTIDEGRVEKDISMNEIEQVSKIVSNLGTKIN